MQKSILSRFHSHKYKDYNWFGNHTFLYTFCSWNKTHDPFIVTQMRNKKTLLNDRFPSKQFQVLWTPSSGFFSSFPHGTCSLSISCPYLALDRTYDPLSGRIPTSTTLWYPLRTYMCCRRKTRLSLSMSTTLWFSKRTKFNRERRGYHSPWRLIPKALFLIQIVAKRPSHYNSSFGGF